MTVIHPAVVGLLWACYDSTMAVCWNSSVGGGGGGGGRHHSLFLLTAEFLVANRRGVVVLTCVAWCIWK